MELETIFPVVPFDDPSDFKGKPSLDTREREEKTARIREQLKTGIGTLTKPVKNVLIATPVKGGLPPHYVHAALACTAGIQTDEALWRCTFMMLEGGSLTLARNVLSHQFLKSKADAILFIDADMMWTPEHCGRLLSHPEAIVGGIYLARETDERYIVNGADHTKQVGDLVPCVEMGTGMLRVLRAPFEEIPKHFPESNFVSHDPNYMGDIMHDFFPSYAIGNELLSEDFFFCRRAKTAGFQVWADSRCIVPHVGKKSFYPKEKKTTDA